MNDNQQKGAKILRLLYLIAIILKAYSIISIHYNKIVDVEYENVNSKYSAEEFKLIIKMKN